MTVEAPRALTLARYGPSMAAAAADTTRGWYANRMTDEFYGAGKYRRKGRKTKRRRSHRGNGLYTGQGAFWDDAKNWWNRNKGQVGRGVKAGLEATGYGNIANAITHAETLGRALGMGEYSVNNDIVDGGAGQDIPTFSGGPTSVCISHKEYISDVFGPEGGGQFQNTFYSINPGIERTFPWLSQIAVNYEEYTLKQCIFTFRSTVTDFVATNGQVGSIIMATQYNPSDTPFQSKQDAMEYDMAMSGKCSANMLHGVECDPAQLSGSPGKYVRAGPVRSDDDLKQYDWGNLNVAISNIPKEFVNQALGELWVSYTIELRKPKFFVSRGLNILRDTFVGSWTVPGAVEDISEMDYGYAQQCRIGGELITGPAAATLFTSEGVPHKQVQTKFCSGNGAGYICYTFPATFSGSVKLKFTCARYQAGSTSYAGYVGMLLSGNDGALKEIKDLFTGGIQNSQPPIWQSAIQGAATTASNSQCVTEFHVVVSSPTSAGATTTASLNNRLFICCKDWNISDYAEGATVNCQTWQLDIEVYNTGFNYPSSGNLIVMNPVTDLQEEWP